MASLTLVRKWQKRYRELTEEDHGVLPDYDRDGETVIPAANEFEKSLGVKLPGAYLAFAQVFGPGEVGGYYRINVPGVTGENYDLLREHQEWKESREPFQDNEKGKRLSRLIHFASTIGGETLCWDPTDVTDERGPEYRIYYVTRRDDATAIAASFEELIEEIALKDTLHERMGWKPRPRDDDEDEWPPQTFLPYRW